LLDWSGFLINSHDPLRGHVLKHIRQNSLTSLRYSVAEQGNESRRCCVRKRTVLGILASVAYATLAGDGYRYAQPILPSYKI